MNKDDALAKLLEIVDTCLFDETFINELLDIIRNSGIEDSILSILFKDIRVLLEFKENTHILLPKCFEKLKNCEMYSMIIKKKHNIRVLYNFINGQPILLLAFYERSGKRKTGYDDRIAEAEKRLAIANNTYKVNKIR